MVGERIRVKILFCDHSLIIILNRPDDKKISVWSNWVLHLYSNNIMFDAARLLKLKFMHKRSFLVNIIYFVYQNWNKLSLKFLFLWNCGYSHPLMSKMATVSAFFRRFTVNKMILFFGTVIFNFLRTHWKLSMISKTSKKLYEEMFFDM